ncbi:hypothetical protein ANOM_010209 [Aspergillus nomiae NRRL 13137]|uniref:DHHC zinc finger membrane protein n=1 Tax=Aspergillus nomiae NRRL (strain ATCC 15546 / NRRL 13137 / CBS 260.88 / M93) TaxID=1509407 RepID=A0A0L1IRK8_ASPN3|nr:uncharacterized protein ANOM_010209 [Aspergillus nomiae NRRL 13137]KNG81843.1 hypothetical protein ANOM_010209 [Aspergillus nomiae NRRL 13137]
MFFNVWTIVISSDLRIGGVTSLMFMTAPLAMAFLVYHTYLIWAGMTTNESAKWSDWKEDVADAEAYGNSPLLREYQNPQSYWPASSDQVLVVTEGEPPRMGFVFSPDSNEIRQPNGGEAPIDHKWTLVRSMREIDNIYDLGFWDNLRHSFGLPARRKMS